MSTAVIRVSVGPAYRVERATGGRHRPGRSHGIVKDGAHRYADHADGLGGFGPLWGAAESVVQNGKHVLEISDLLPTRRVAGVDGPAGDLIPHLSEVHVNAWGPLDEGLELAEHRDQLQVRVRVDVPDLPAQPLGVNAVVRWKPIAMPGCNNQSRQSAGDSG